MPEDTTSTATDDTSTATTTTAGTTTDPAEVLEQLRALTDELGLTPEQIKGRLDASRKWEKRAKDNAAAAQRVAELENAGKSDDTKVVEAQNAAAAARAQLKRYEIAAELQLPASVAHLLTGADEDEMRQAGEDLIAFAKTHQKAAAPDLKQGNRGGAPTADSDPNAWLRAMRRNG